MKFVLSFALSLFPILVTSLSADYTAEVVENRLDAPYNAVGQIIAGRKSGSGFLLENAHVMATAAHVALSDTSFLPITSLRVRWQGSNNEDSIRSVLSFSSYGDAVEEFGENAPEAFTQDLAIGYSYARFQTPGGTPLEIPETPPSVTGAEEKMILGHPVGLYGGSDPDRNSLHRVGPFTGAFFQDLDHYYRLVGVAFGAGGSGGPALVRSADDWQVAGVYVSGLELSTGGIRNSVGIVLFDEASTALVHEAVDLVESYPRPASRWTKISGGKWEEGAQYALAIQNSDRAVWEAWLEPFDLPAPVDSLDWIEVSDTAVTVTIPPASVEWQGVYIKGRFNGPWGPFLLPEFRFSYDDLVDPKVRWKNWEADEITVPHDESIEFTAEVEGLPAPTIEWRLTLPGIPGYGHPNEIQNRVPIEIDEENLTITIPPNLGYLEGGLLQIHVSNPFGGDWTQNIRLNYTGEDVFSTQWKAFPVGLVPYGGEAVFELATETLGPAPTVRWQAWMEEPWTTYDGIGNRFVIPNQDAGIEGMQVTGSIEFGVERAAGIETFTEALGPFTIRAAAPVRLRDVNYEVSTAGAAKLRLRVESFDPPAVEWQFSSDDGACWKPLPPALFRTSLTDSGFEFELPNAPTEDILLRGRFENSQGVTLSESFPLSGRNQPAAWLPPASKWMEARAIQTAETGGANVIAVRVRESTENAYRNRVEVSADMISWAVVPSEEWNRSVLDEDVDGEGKTRLVEYRLPAEDDGMTLYYRVIEE
jgi:hypothetical protein